MKYALFVLSAILAAAQPKHEMVPMRDGVELSTFITLPSGKGPFPTVLVRTPYEIRNQRNGFVDIGYAVVEQNFRGLFKSEGKWPVFGAEMNDGYDAVEWIAKQPWSDGKVGILGGSAPGMAALLAMMSGAPHLTAGFIQVAHADPYHAVTYPGGVYQAGLMDSWVKARGAEIPPPFPRPIFRRFDDEYKRQTIGNFASNVKIPVLHQSGWFDIFTQGSIDAFNAIQKFGSEKAKGNQKLIVHPRGHGGKLPGELQWPGEFPNADSLHRKWFDYWMRDIDTGVRAMPAVQYYVMGDPRAPQGPGNAWKSSAGWPPITAATSYYLQPSGALRPIAPKDKTGSQSYEYDPRNPVPSIQSRAGDWLNRPPLDQRAVKDRADILRFRTMPLSEPVEIAGRVSAELFVSTTAKDTDFFVRLIDIHPDGFEAVLASQPLRLRFREGFDKMLPAVKNKVYRIEIDMWSTAAVFAKGHRIGVQITSSDSPRFDKHSNTWEPVKSYDAAVVATNTVHYSADRASRVILPIVAVKK